MKPIQAAPGARHTVLALALGALLLLATACGGGGSTNNGGSGGTAGKPAGAKATATADNKASSALVTIMPKDGANDVATNGVLKVSAASGKLTSVIVKDDKGTAVKGETAADGASWAPSEHLGTSTKYTVDAIAKDSDGRASAKHATFTTITPKDSFVGFYTPENGQTVGVGMEIYLNFNRGITNKKAVEDAVQVTTSPAIEVKGHWNGNDQLFLRPESYWAAGTKVTLSLRLDGVEGAPGVYGTQKKDVHFTVGRSQVSVVDAAKHTMTVTRDGQVLRTIPITSGAPATTTYNGKMVITEKYEVTRMNGDTVGFGGEYDIKDVPHAMRLTNSGTFIHGNYWAEKSVFGNSNASHGCVGLSDSRGAGDPSTPAAWFYNQSIAGDVVQVINSKDKTVQWYNGLNGWNLPWSEWTS
ncbi:Ig-like domain-containing protein [Streptomyces sp. H10-C2]|uniref:L,D-transpeptidase n=1 Tax=unclassified Streptomyces TaxID=2593676 RepID=UPI0024BB3BAC|nr:MULTISPECIES: Ig-like domain-containing protein [unclassified Streptomyces]MDJ0341441.1 Ig-like domain-containing protein [Streptomyces sp. PH10-H1]MDJ0369098.1 Ig-like domain-containing protein [Streptomyces sp. H10-C2]